MTGTDAVETLAHELKVACATARTEEDVKIACETIFRRILPQLGIDATPRYETSYGKRHGFVAGRSDAVYGQLVIEYERKGSFKRDSVISHAAEQLERYAVHESGLANPARVAGVGIDGEQIFFLHFRPTPEEPVALPLFADVALASSRRTPTYDRVGPFEIGPASIADLLVYFRSLERRPLQAELLAESFGPASPHARTIVARLIDAFNKLDLTHSRRYAEWSRIFGIVYGVDETRGTKYIAELKARYNIADTITLRSAFFAIHTYFALLMKLLAAELVSLQGGSLLSSFLSTLDGIDPQTMRGRFIELEAGDFYAGLGVTNFLEGDFFSWYLKVDELAFWTELKALCRELSHFEPASGVLDSATTRDLLKELYEVLIPRSLRHHLGEYYTPDWLADLTLDEVQFDGSPDARILDPACGSGTFLALAIRRIREAGDLQLRDRKETARHITRNVVGFDINPLAVIAARTNFLLALGPLLRHVTPFALPIYLCDSVLSPLRGAGVQIALGHGGLLATSQEIGETIPVATGAGTLHVPTEVVADSKLLPTLQLIETQLRLGSTRADFVAAASPRLGYTASSRILQLTGDLFEQMRSLSDPGDELFWPRYLKNSLAPVTVGRFNYVIGNPPWIGWEELSIEYRRATASMWNAYGLFTLRGHAAHLGGGKKDLSMLMLYSVADNLLELNGRLGFVMTQSVLKSRKAGDGFRRFRLGDAEPLKVDSVDDFSSLNPFQATNLTVVLSFTKGTATEYPIRYNMWSAPRGVRPNNRWPLRQVKQALTSRRFEAAPISRRKRTSPWLTLPLGLDRVRDEIKPAEYVAQAGVSTWLNSIFFVEPQKSFADGSIVVKNINEAGDIPVAAVEAPVEAALLFPTCRMRDVKRWGAQPSCWTIVPQDPVSKRGWPIETMRVDYPLTLAYLTRFERELRSRSGYKKYHEHAGNPWYSIYNVDSSAFRPYHVFWQQMRPQIDACVVSSWTWEGITKPIVTQHVVSSIAFDDEDEAHYVAAWLNSSLCTVISMHSSTGKSYGTPSFLENIPIPRFDRFVAEHVNLCALSREAHSGADPRSVQRRIDFIVSTLLAFDEETAARVVREAGILESEPLQPVLI